MPRDLTDDESALIRAMTWCRQTTGNNALANVDPVLCRHMLSLHHNGLKAIYVETILSVIVVQ